MGHEFSFRYNRKDETTQIDFGKLKSGLTKEDLGIEDGTILGSIFDSIDTNVGSEGKLDRQELSIFNNIINDLAGNDAELSLNEAKKFKLSKDFSREETGNSLIEFLGKLSGLTKGISSVLSQKDGSFEIIKYDDGSQEQVFADGSRIVTVKNGDITVNTKYDKNNNIIEEEQVFPNGTKTVTTKNENEIKTTSFDSNGNITVQFIYDQNNFTVNKIEYQNGKKVRQTIQNSNNTEVTEFDSNEDVLSKTVTYNNGTEIVYDSKNRPTQTKRINDKNQTEEIKISYDGDNYTIDTSLDGQKVSQEQSSAGVIVVAEYVTVEIGNPPAPIVCTKGIIVQDGERFENIARKFNCDMSLLKSINKEHISTANGLEFFIVGSSILIPREIPAAELAQLQQGRKDSKGAETSYVQTEARMYAMMLEKAGISGFITYNGDLSFLGQCSSHKELARKILKYELCNDEYVKEYLTNLIYKFKEDGSNAEFVKQLYKTFGSGNVEQLSNGSIGNELLGLLNGSNNTTTLKSTNFPDDFLRKRAGDLISYSREYAAKNYDESSIDPSLVAARAQRLKNVDPKNLSEARIEISSGLISYLNDKNNQNTRRQTLQTSLEIYRQKEDTLAKGKEIYERISNYYNNVSLASVDEIYQHNFSHIFDSEKTHEETAFLLFSYDTECSIIDTILNDLGANFNATIVSKLVTALEQYAHNAGVNLDQIKDKSIDYTNEADVKRYVKYLMGLISQHGKDLADVSAQEAMQMFTGNYNGVLNNATDDIEKLKKEYCGFTRFVQSLFAENGAGYFTINMDLTQKRHYFNEMTKIANKIENTTNPDEIREAIKTFEDLYTKITGVTFNIDNFRRAQAALDKMQEVEIVNATVSKYVGYVKDIQNSDNFDDALVVVNHMCAGSEEITKELLTAVAASVGLTVEEFNNKNDLDKKRALLDYFNNSINITQALLTTALDGQNMIDVENDVVQSLEILYGTKGNISIDMKQLQESMQTTSTTLTVASEMVLTIALCFVPGGTALMAGKLAQLATKLPRLAKLLNTIAKGAQGICKLQSSGLITGELANGATTGISNAIAQLTVAGKVDPQRAVKSAIFGYLGSWNNALVSNIFPKGSFVAEGLLNGAQAFLIETAFGNEYGSLDFTLDFALDIVMAKMGVHLSSSMSKGDVKTIDVKDDKGNVVGRQVQKMNEQGDIEIESYDLNKNLLSTTVVKKGEDGRLAFKTTNADRSVTEGILNSDGNVYKATRIRNTPDGREVALKIDSEGNRNLEIADISGEQLADPITAKNNVFQQQIDSVNTLEEAIALKNMLKEADADEKLIKQLDEKIEELNNKVKDETVVEKIDSVMQPLKNIVEPIIDYVSRIRIARNTLPMGFPVLELAPKKQNPASQVVTNSNYNEVFGMNIAITNSTNLKKLTKKYNEILNLLNKEKSKWPKFRQDKSLIERYEAALEQVDNFMETHAREKRVINSRGEVTFRRKDDPILLSDRDERNFVAVNETTVVIDSDWDFGFSGSGYQHAGYSEMPYAGKMKCPDLRLPRMGGPGIVCKYNAETDHSVISIRAKEAGRGGSVQIFLKGKVSQEVAEKYISYLQQNIPEFLPTTEYIEGTSYKFGETIEFLQNGEFSRLTKEFFNNKLYLEENASLGNDVSSASAQNINQTEFPDNTLSNQSQNTDTGFVDNGINTVEEPPVAPEVEVETQAVEPTPEAEIVPIAQAVDPIPVDTTQTPEIIDPIDYELMTTSALIDFCCSEASNKNESAFETLKNRIKNDLTNQELLDILNTKQYHDNANFINFVKRVTREKINNGTLKYIQYNGKIVLLESLTNQDLVNIYNDSRKNIKNEDLRNEILKRINNGTLIYDTMTRSLLVNQN